MNKGLYLGLPILKLIKTVMWEVWYDYVKLEYSFIAYIKTNDTYKHISEDVETRFYSSNYELNRQIWKGWNKKVISVISNELGGKIMKYGICIWNAYGMRKDLLSEKEEINCKNVIKQCIMINFDGAAKENMKQYDPNWPQISDHSYRILIIAGSGSGETNSLFNLISHHPDIDKISLYAKDPFEAKYWFLINKQEKNRLKTFGAVNTKTEQNCNVWNLVWLCETVIWWKSRILILN